jgi:hypothetical protein
MRSGTFKKKIDYIILKDFLRISIIKTPGCLNHRTKIVRFVYNAFLCHQILYEFHREIKCCYIEYL